MIGSRPAGADVHSRASRRPPLKTLHQRCAGLAVHKREVVACLRLATKGRVQREVRRFATTTSGLLELAEWLEAARWTIVALEATGVYCKPVEPVLLAGMAERGRARDDRASDAIGGGPHGREQHLPLLSIARPFFRANAGGEKLTRAIDA